MFRVPIRSRVGNAVLGVLGGVYVVSASATLVYYLISNWGANSLIDRVLQLGLLGAAIAGVVFVLIALQNLRVNARDGSAAKSPTAPAHRTAPAAES